MENGDVTNGHRDELEAGPRIDNRVVRPSPIWSPEVIEDIQEKADIGRYRIRAVSTLRKPTSFDDLTFIPCTLTPIPLQGYRERCETPAVIGGRHGATPLTLETPITIAGMSYGALSANAQQALGWAATRVGISTTTGDGGMRPGEREDC